MKKFLHILGGIFLLLGVIWIVAVVVAVATKDTGYTSFLGVIPGLAIHTVLNLLGLLFIGLARRTKKQTA